MCFCFFLGRASKKHFFAGGDGSAKYCASTAAETGQQVKLLVGGSRRNAADFFPLSRRFAEKSNGRPQALEP